MQVAVGIGVSSVRFDSAGSGGSLTGPGVSARVGWRLRNGLTLGAEFGVFGINDEEPRADDLSTTGFNAPLVVNRTPRVAQTRTIGAFLQWTRPSGVLVRVGGGLGGHAYAFYYPYPPDPSASESMEFGLMFAAAVGKEFRRMARFGLATEGFFFYSTGEDSSSARTVLGVQVVPIWRVGRGR